MSQYKYDDTHICVYSDGSMREEGTDKAVRNTGWGIVGYHWGREIFSGRGGMGHKAEVYDAELVGLTQATKAATEYTRWHEQVRHVHVFADNTAAVTSIYEPKPTPGQLQMVRTTHMVDDFLNRDEGRTFSIEWCPGHKDVEGNERADEEAKLGSEAWSQDFTTMTNAKRSTKESALEEWRKDWQRASTTGGFSIANRMKPRWKPREHVTHTPREVFGRLTQCRTKHAFIGEYYAKFVANEPIGCPCGVRLQTREHVILECPRYEEHRDILREADERMDLGRLLGTKDGIEAMVKFLGKTGAFTKTGTKKTERTVPTINDVENDMNEEEWWRRMEGDREGAYGLLEDE